MEQARRSPLGFAILNSRNKYTSPRHIKLINEKLLALDRREIRRLAVLMPPRHAKSSCCSLAFPAWYLGNHPDHRFVLATHTASYAESWGRKVRDAINEYGPPLFGISVKKDTKAAGEWELQGSYGGMLSVGCGTSVSGRGADVFAIDDAIANPEQALSPTFRDKQWDWYLSVADTRLEPNAIEVVLMTPWHPDDLIARIIKSWSESSLPYEVIRLPALAEANDPLGRQLGEALWPERYDIEALEEKRRKSMFWWDALYRCQPTPEGGAIFKADWFQHYQTIEYGAGQLTWQLTESGQLVFQKACIVFMVVDPALGRTNTGDNTAIVVFAYEPRIGDYGVLLVLHAIAERIPVQELIPLVEKTAEAWGVQWVGMEANGFQGLLAQSARKEIGVTVREMDPQGRSKLSRAVPAIERAHDGGMFLPDDVTAKWLPAFLAELCEWSGNEGDKDDQCLAAGTKIWTARGHVPIEMVEVGDLVMTRRGWRSVSWSGMTNQDAETVSINICGKNLTATRNHPIWTPEGFLPIDALRYATRVGVCEPNLYRSFSTGSNTEDTLSRSKNTFASTIGQEEIAGRQGLALFIETSGSRFTDRFRPGMLFITKTEISSITQSRTLSVLVQASIEEGILSKAILARPRSSQILIESGRSQPLGIRLKKAELGTSSTARTYGLAESRSTYESASIAESNTRPISRLTYGSALTNAHRQKEGGQEPITKYEYVLDAKSRSRPIATRRPFVVFQSAFGFIGNSKRQPVYNLTVESEHEFFANGILVHNCDCVAYAAAECQRYGGKLEMVPKKQSRPLFDRVRHRGQSKLFGGGR